MRGFPSTFLVICVFMTSWAEGVSKLIAENLKALRKRADLSAAEVSKRTADMGHPISRSVISDFESGRKKNISVPDFLVLAYALDALPLELLYGSQRDRVAVLPDLTVAIDEAWHSFNHWNFSTRQPVELMEQRREARSRISRLMGEIERDGPNEEKKQDLQVEIDKLKKINEELGRNREDGLRQIEGLSYLKELMPRGEENGQG